MHAVCMFAPGADPAAVAVMMEDGAAVAGLFIAGGCLAICQVGPQASSCCYCYPYMVQDLA